MGAVSKAPSTGRSSGTWTGGLRHRPHWVTLVVTFPERPRSDLHTLLGTAQVLLCLLLMKILRGRPLCPFHWGGRRGAEALRGAPGHTAAWGGARPERGGEIVYPLPTVRKFPGCVRAKEHWLEWKGRGRAAPKIPSPHRPRPPLPPSVSVSASPPHPLLYLRVSVSASPPHPLLYLCVSLYNTHTEEEGIKEKKVWEFRGRVVFVFFYIFSVLRRDTCYLADLGSFPRLRPAPPRVTTTWRTFRPADLVC